MAAPTRSDAMIDSLREAFRQAVANFRTELNRDRVPEAADRLLRAMQAELIEFERRGAELARELERTREESVAERRAAETCVRREEMARRIDDFETAAVAREFAQKHLHRHDILGDKAAVLERQLEDHRAGMTEMTEQLRRARAQRESLAASVGRTDTRESLREADRLFDEMDRIAEVLRAEDARGAAIRELDEALGLGDQGPGRREPTTADLDERLDELKRRMNRS